MKISDIITEAEQQDLDKSLDDYFKRRDLEKQKAAQKQQRRAAPAPASEPTGPEPDDPYHKTMHKLNAPKEKKPSALSTFAKGVQKGWEKGQDVKQALEPIGRAYDKFNRHPLVRPK